MPAAKIKITPIDPLISRDSRPFGQGQKARSLSWVTPSAVCGSLRSFVGKTIGRFETEKLKSIRVRGPFLEHAGTLYFPRPLDFVTNQNMEELEEMGKTGKMELSGYAIRPGKMPGGYAEMPLPGLLQPLIANNDFNNNNFDNDDDFDDFEPEPVPAFWSADAMNRWLFGNGKSFSLQHSECLRGPEQDERTHVKIGPGALEGSLFSTTGLDFRLRRKVEIRKTKIVEFSQMNISIEAAFPEDYREVPAHFPPHSPHSLHPLGGERRLAAWSRETRDVKGWDFPQSQPQPQSQLQSQSQFQAPDLSEASRLRMVLATPAVFSRGWRPGWIGGEGNGTVPGTDIELRLVSAVTGRRQPISGWSYETGKRGIKPLRRMVPAGSVYFFEAAKGIKREHWENLWLRSVCDDIQDQKDGFGSALWGTW